MYKKPFAQYFHEKVKEGEGRTLLGKMQALEVGVSMLRRLL